MNRPLNWREIKLLADWIDPLVKGMFVDRVIVPERPEFPDGFLKGEWSLRLTSRAGEAALLFSVRPKRPYIDWIVGKGPRASRHATRSGFDLSLTKTFAGRKVLGLEAVQRERALILWVEGDAGNPLGLVLTLIPALPEALLIEKKGFKILARTRNVKEEVYQLPDGSGSPEHLVARPAFSSLEVYTREIRESVDLEAFESRLTRVRARISQDLKQAKTRLSQNQKTLIEAEKETDYRHLGDLLKSAMGQNPPLSPQGTRTVMDWETGEKLEIKCDLKLNLKEQVEKFYALSKRKDRRISEAKLRIETFSEKAAALEKIKTEIDRIALSALRGRMKISELAPYEERLGLQAGAPEKAEAKASHGWSGKSFVSKEGLPILVGRSKDENLELTFKFARGNDIWMHVRGKPSAHVVIPLRSKKNASLETLLDAAYLCLHYSNASNWGKTEVDYTQKKYVKRIKDSSEASYVNNKTLVVELDPKRIKELFSQELV